MSTPMMPPTAAPNSTKHRITIEIDEMGTLSVNGPLNNLLVFVGMCELAKEAAFAMNRKTQEVQRGGGIVIPTPKLPGV